jgi:DNA-binding response OmpR family regulator
MNAPVPVILVVDDDINALGMIGYILERAGFRVDKATRGAEALEKIKAHPPALVILDLMMPGMSGIEVCRTLRADPATKRLPVLVLSALSDMRTTTEALVAGANHYLVKPARPRELIEHVRALMGEKG